MRARESLSKRIGFSSQKSSNLYKVAPEGQKLTIEEVNEYVVTRAFKVPRVHGVNGAYRYDMHRHIATEAPIRYRSQQWLGPETHALGPNGADYLSQL